MGFRDWLDWEESVFRALLSGWQRWAPAAAASATEADAAVFENEAGALSVLGQLLSGEPVRVRPARGVGGLRGMDLLLPSRLRLWPDAEANREAYRVQLVVASGMRRLARQRPVPDDDRFEGALATLELAGEAVELMASELPQFRNAHDRLAARVLELRSEQDPSQLVEPEATLERARRAALAGEPVWKDPALRKRLVGKRGRRHRSPPLPIWGEWLRAAEDAVVGTPQEAASEPTAAPEPTTEIDAPAMDAIERVNLDPKDTENPPPSAPFERAETLDGYQGGARDLDGTDELEAHLDALEEVDLGALFRGDQTSQSLLKADLELGVGDARSVEIERVGIRYDEWDARRGAYRKDWCTVYPERVETGDPAWVHRTLTARRDLIRRLRLQLEAQRAGLRPVPRQLDGEDIDLAAAIDAQVSRAAGREPDPRVYVRQRKRRRDFATTVLLDVSMSTDSWVDGRCILDVGREAALVLGEVAEQLGDRIQILAFASETRNQCHVWTVVDFDDAWQTSRDRIGALTPRGYTRIGPALRHSTAMLMREPAEKRLLLLISDGKPTDYDRYEGRYGVADVRMALREAGRSEIQTHALAVDAVARDYLPALFGEGGWHILPEPDDLLEALTAVYGRFTRR